MKIAEKIERLTRVMRRNQLCREAGLPVTTISELTTGRTTSITTVKAVALARALGVDIGWFVDDSRDWPPVYVKQENAVA